MTVNAPTGVDFDNAIPDMYAIVAMRRLGRKLHTTIRLADAVTVGNEYVRLCAATQLQCAVLSTLLASWCKFLVSPLVATGSANKVEVFEGRI